MISADVLYQMVGLFDDNMPCILMYGAFECHFKPVRLSKIELRHPVDYRGSEIGLKKIFYPHPWNLPANPSCPTS